GDARNEWTREVGGAEEPVLPSRIISTSNCVAKQFPDVYLALEEDCSPERAAEFGLHDSHGAHWFIRENTGTFFFPCGECLTVAGAREFIRGFLRARDPDRLLVGVAVHRRHREALLKACPLPEQRPGCAPIAPSADYEFIQRDQPPEPGGELVGYDVRLANHQLECSWLCGGHEVDFARELNIRPNDFGLI